MRNPKNIGNVSEALIIARLLASGRNVSIPFGDNQRYDLVVEHRKHAGKFIRVQCKTGRLIGGAIIFNVANVTWNGKRRDYHGDIDAFIVYCPQNDSVYAVPISLCGSSSMNLRIDAPANGQSSGINWARDFLLR